MFAKLFYFGPSLARLHDDYAKKHRIDEDAPLVSSSSIDIDAPLERVWNAISDLRGWSRWAPAEVLDFADVRPGAHFTWKLNGVSIRSTFAVVDARRELTWTGQFFGFKAVDRQTLEPLDGGGTRATLEESLAGPLLPLFYSSSKLKANHLKWLTALKTFAEGRPELVPLARTLDCR
jgi:hypothetical protein